MIYTLYNVTKLNKSNNFIKVFEEHVRKGKYKKREVCIMYNELKNKNIIIDLEQLIQNVDNADDINSYAEFMKERILSVSSLN